MTNKAELLKELDSQFRKTQMELGFSAGFEEIDRYFFVRDLILEKGFVSDNFSNQLRGRIVDVLISWDNYLHNLVMPNPQNLFSLNESKALNESDKKGIMKMMSRIAHFVSRNSLVRISHNAEDEARIIDESVAFWKDDCEPFFLKIMEKVEVHWKEEEKKGEI